MKRYRTTTLSFDSRANILNHKIEDSWESSIKAQWEKNKIQIRENLKAEFGAVNFSQKEKNFIEMEAMFPSIVFFHNRFLTQIRNSFVMESYYSALTGATTLTERILNHLIFILKDDFRLTPEYKEVYNKSSFTDWDLMVRILTSWNVLLFETKTYIQKLKELRHQYAAHFNPVTDFKDRELALKAINLFQEFIKIQFGGFGSQPWFIKNTKGEFFLKKSYEENPFIKKIYLPNCLFVGPRYELIHTLSGFKVKDEEYDNIEISDEQFVVLREEYREKKI